MDFVLSWTVLNQSIALDKLINDSLQLQVEKQKEIWAILQNATTMVPFSEAFLENIIEAFAEDMASQVLATAFLGVGNILAGIFSVARNV